VRADFRQRSAETLDLTIARQVAWKLAHRVLELPVRACSDQSATGLRVIAPCCLYSRSRMHACRHSTIGEMRVWGGGDEMNLWFSKIFDKRMNFEIGMGGGGTASASSHGWFCKERVPSSHLVEGSVPILGNSIDVGASRYEKFDGLGVAPARGPMEG